MKARLLLFTCFMLLTAMSGLAQDANISQIRQDASAVDRHPGGDREYYGLWYKDHLLGRPEPKPRFESAEDSIQKRKEFIRLCAVAFEASAFKKRAKARKKEAKKNTTE